MPSSRFHFPLAPVLDLRDRAVDDARRALAEAARARSAAEAAAERAEAQLQASLESRADGPTPARSLLGLATRQSRATGALAAARRTLTRRTQAEASARAALVDALRQHQSVQTLHDDAYDAFRLDLDRAETAALDDLAGLRGGSTSPWTPPSA